MVMEAMEIVGVIVGDFIDFALEGGTVLRRPLIMPFAVFVEIRAGGIETMADFVPDDHANVTI